MRSSLVPYYVSSHRFQQLDAVPVPDHGHPFAGFGWNWFDHLGSGGLYAEDPSYRMDQEVLPDPEDRAGWASLEVELDALRPSFIRFGLPPEPHTATDGSLITGTKHIQRLQWLDRWAVRSGCTVLVDLFTIPTAYGFPMPASPREGMSHCNMAARDNDDFARRFVAPLLSHLVHDLGLQSVRAFNPVNEALQYGVYQTPETGPDSYVHYAGMFRALRYALDAVGLSRDRIKLVGCDCLAERDLFTYEFHARGVEIDPWVDAYSAHFYNLRFDTLPPGDGSWSSPNQDVIRRVESWQRLLRHRGKPLWVGEIGTFYYGWRENNPSGAASFDACLTVAEGVLRLIAAGARAFAVWELFDTDDNDGCWSALQYTGDGRWLRQGAKHAIYGTLCRALRPGSAMWSLRSQPTTNLASLYGIAACGPDGQRTLVLTNHDPLHNWEAELTLPEPFRGAPWTATVIDRSAQPRLAEPPHEGEQGTLRLTVPAFSLLSLSAPP